MSRGWKNFEEILEEKASIALKRFLAELWMLQVILMKTRKEKRKTIDKVSIALWYTYHYKQNVDRHKNIKVISSEITDRNEGCIIGNWRKGDFCYKAAKNLTKLCYSVLWKVKLINNKLGYLAEEISKQNIEDMARFFFSDYNKCETKEINWRRN